MKPFFFCALVVLLFGSAQAQLRINEILYDPSNTALEGDANGDGIYDQTQDEFIEFINTASSDLDVSRYRIYEHELATNLKTLRHTIPMNTIIPPNGALVIFGGGGAVGSFGGAVVRVDIGTQGLSLTNSGESVIVEDSSGNYVDSVDTDQWSDNPNQSYTRDPAVTGDYVKHNTVFASALFSPGTQPNGTPFPNVLFINPAKQKSTLLVYPNPGNGLFRILDGSGNNTPVLVRDALGKVVFEGLPTDGRLDLRFLADGLYHVQTLSEQALKGQSICIRK
jgi:hypothetical protein